MKPGLHVISEGITGNEARVLFQPKIDPDDWFQDPTPIDLSASFQSADIRIEVGEPNRVHLSGFLTGGQFTGKASMVMRWFKRLA